MTAGIIIERPGLLSTLQDRGRRGLRHLGIPWSGCLNPTWQQLGNTLAGNEADHCVIECFEGGLQFQVGQAPVRMAVMASPSLRMSVDSETASFPVLPCRSYTLTPGSKVSLISTGAFRHAIVSLTGLQIEQQLGSTSTYSKANLGGLNGKVLQAGDVLPTATQLSGSEYQCIDPLSSAYANTVLRVVLGPQQENFSTRGIETFLNSEFEMGADADRMGVRLTGPAIEHRDEAAKNPVSDAIVPGSIQVPGNGQPIVLLNDAHTAGGYPKIATVLSIDLPLLALQRAGTCFSFESLSIDEAIDAVRDQRQLVEQALSSIKPLTDTAITTEILFANNLIDGVTAGHENP